MATTSGLINTVVVTRDELITDALQDIGVVQDGNPPTAGDITDASRKLNYLLKLWPTKGLFLWTRDIVQIPLVVGQQSYTIGPDATGNHPDVISYRPLRALDGSFLRSTVGGVTNDISLTVYSRLEYEQQAAKGSLGTVTAVYYDPQMTTTPNASYNPAISRGVLRVWTTQSDISQTQTVFLMVQRPIQDMINADDAFDMPLEWYEALSKNLQASLVGKYGIPLQQRQIIKQEAQMALAEVADWAAVEEAPVNFIPDFRMGR